MKKMLGGPVASLVEDKIKNDLSEMGANLTLAVILIGNDPASEKYVEFKKKACERVGISFKLFTFDENEPEEKALNKINELNNDDAITGIIVQLPLPRNYVPNNLLQKISPQKDVDGLTSTNLGKLIKGIPGLFPATPEGVMALLEYYGIDIKGRKVAVIGQSNLVGKPLAQMLLNKNATVLIANKETPDISKLTLESDIVISAVGQPNLITGVMISPGSVVVDVGTTLVDGKIVGDVDYDTVSLKASYITPSPGGVGPMTVAMLLSNVVKAYKFKRGLNA